MNETKREKLIILDHRGRKSHHRHQGHLGFHRSYRIPNQTFESEIENSQIFGRICNYHGDFPGQTLRTRGKLRFCDLAYYLEICLADNHHTPPSELNRLEYWTQWNNRGRMNSIVLSFCFYDNTTSIARSSYSNNSSNFMAELILLKGGRAAVLE